MISKYNTTYKMDFNTNIYNPKGLDASSGSEWIYTSVHQYKQ